MTLIVCFLNLLSEVRILSNLVTIGSFSLCVPTLPNWIAINIVVVETKFFSFFLLSGFSFTDTDDSQDSRGREGTFFYSTLPLPPAHKHSDIYLHFLVCHVILQDHVIQGHIILWVTVLHDKSKPCQFWCS